MGNALAGWFADPSGRHTYRYWDGQRWTGHVSDNGQVRIVNEPAPKGPPDERAALRYVAVFLDDARRARAVGPGVIDVLEARVRARLAALDAPAPVPAAATPSSATPSRATPFSATPASATPTQPAAPSEPTGSWHPDDQWRPADAWHPGDAPTPAARPARPARPGPAVPQPAARAHRPSGPTLDRRAPSRAVRPEPAWRAHLRTAGHRIGADLAVHWLTYVGVLMVFVGLFGFVAFAFAEVRIGLRPLAEVAIPLTIAGVSRFVRRQGAPRAARVLAVTAAALTPVVVVAAWNDGAAIPPDPVGAARAWATGLSLIALGAAFAVWSVRRPASPVRTVALPSVWLGVALTAMVTRDPLPAGSEVASAGGTQMAIAMAAVALTTWAARLPAARAWRTTIEREALGATAVAALLAVLAGIRDGWPVGPAVVTGALTIVVVELVRARVPAWLRGWLVVTLTAASAASLHPAVTPGWQAFLALTALILVLEVEGRHQPGRNVVAPLLGAALLAYVAAMSGPWPAVAASALAATWLWLRQRHPASWLAAGAALDAPIAVTTTAGLVALLVAAPEASTLFGIGAAIALVTWAAPQLGLAEHRLARIWLPSAAGTVTLAATTTAFGAIGWWSVAAAAAGALALVRARLPWAARLWATSTAVAVAGALACTAADLDIGWRGVAAATIGLTMVALAAARHTRASAHLAAMGHLLALLACLDAGGQTTRFDVVLTMLVLGWWITAVDDAWRGAPLVRAAQRLAPEHDEVSVHPSTVVRLAFDALALAGAPLVVVRWLERTGTVTVASPWHSVAVSAVALLYAVLARAATHRRDDLARVLARAAWVGALAGVILLEIPATDAGGWGAHGPVVVGMAAIVIETAVVGRIRNLLEIWCAWLLAAPLALEVGIASGLPDGWRAPLIGAGAAVMGLGAVWTLRAEGLAPARRTRVTWPALTSGALAFGAAAITGVQRGRVELGGWALAIAAVAVIAGAMLHAGIGAGVAAIAAPIGVIALADLDVVGAPWWLVAVAGVLFAATRARVQRPEQADHTWWWRRWDVSPFAVAHLWLAFAALAAPGAGQVPAVYLSGGALLVGVAAARRSWRYGSAGAVAMLIGLAAAGPGWRALAAAIVAVAATAWGARQRDRAAAALAGAVGAAAGMGALGQTVVWREWSERTSMLATAVTMLVILVVFPVIIRRRPEAVGWSLPWALTATVVTGGSATIVAQWTDDYRGWPGSLVLAATLALVIAVAAVAQPLRVAVLRDLAAWALPIPFLLGGALADAATVSTGWGALAMAAVLLAVSGAVGRIGPESAWLRPLLGATTAFVATAAATALVTDTRALGSSALAVWGAEAAVASVVLRRRGLLLASPALVTGAWVWWAADALGGEPLWSSIPAGMAMLITADLVRHDPAEQDRSARAHAANLLDLAGALFVLSPPIGRELTDSLGFALLAVVLGTIVTAWGAIAHVRVRALAGTAAVLLAGLLAVAVPISRVELQWSGASLWLALAGLGLVAILVAATLERGLTLARRGLVRWRELTADWH